MKVNTLLEFTKIKSKRGLIFWFKIYWNHMLTSMIQNTPKSTTKLVHKPKVKTTYPEKDWGNKSEFERINATHKHLKGQLIMRRW